MTRAEIKTILDPVRTWPEERQADLARIALQIEAQNAELAPEDEATKAAIAEGLAQAKQRKFASDRRVKATSKKFGLDVIPAKAGIHATLHARFPGVVDSRLRGNDAWERVR